MLGCVHTHRFAEFAALRTELPRAAFLSGSGPSAAARSRSPLCQHTYTNHVREINDLKINSGARRPRVLAFGTAAQELLLINLERQMFYNLFNHIFYHVSQG